MNKIIGFFSFLAKAFLGMILLAIFFNGFLLKPLLSSSLGLYWDTDVTIQKAKIDWFLPGIALEKVKIGNPYGFPRGDMLEIENARLYFDRQKGFISEGKLKPVLLEIEISKIALMRRVSGHLNLHLLAQPENVRKKSQGLGLDPFQTKISVGEITEMDATSPLLKKQNYNLQNSEFIIGEKTNFEIIVQIFVKMLFQRMGLTEEGNEPLLPAPQYHGIASSVEEEIREHAEKAAEQQAAEAEFEVLSQEAEKKATAVSAKN